MSKVEYLTQGFGGVQLVPHKDEREIEKMTKGKRVFSFFRALPPRPLMNSPFEFIQTLLAKIHSAAITVNSLPMRNHHRPTATSIVANWRAR